MKKKSKDTIQWHPAFQASIQIEFEAEAKKLTFEPEHLLSKKPMQMDELIIKVAETKRFTKILAGFLDDTISSNTKS